MLGALVLVGGFLGGGAQEEALSGFCYSDNTQDRIYFSEVFQTRAGWKDVANLFDGFLKQTYGYVSTSGHKSVCMMLNDAKGAEASKQKLLQDYAEEQKRVVEARWKPSADQEKALTEPKKP